MVDGQKTNMDYTVPALKKGLQILEMFSVRQRVLTIGEVAERLEVSTSAIYRTIVTLTEMHYLKKAGRNAYELGPMVLSRGFCYLASRDILNTAATHLDELRDETSASCHLAIREGIEAIYIYRAASPQVMMVNVPVGTRFPCHTVAIGRALLCGLNDASLRYALLRRPPGRIRQRRHQFTAAAVGRRCRSTADGDQRQWIRLLYGHCHTGAGLHRTCRGGHQCFRSRFYH